MSPKKSIDCKRASLEGTLVSPITVGTSDKVKPYSAQSGISMSAPRVCAHPDNYYSRTDQAFDIDSDPQLAVVNGTQIPQKKSLAELSTSSNSFYYDWDNETIYINKDPNANNVELSKRKEIAVFAGATTFQWKGIGVKHFASSALHPIIYAGLGGAENPNGGELIVENSVFAENAAGTIGISGPKLRSAIRSSVFVNNGSTGLGVNGFASSNQGAPNALLIDGSIFNNNNKANLDVACGASCGAAAVKLNNMTGYTVKNSIFENTQGRGAGLWCDIDCSNAVMVNNISRNNGGPGIFYEISSKGIIANNLTYGNRSSGIVVLASETKVYNNTVVVNENGIGEAVLIGDDNRPAPDKGETWPYSRTEEDAAVVKLCANAGLPANCTIGSPGPNTNRVEYVNNLVVGHPSAGARLNRFGNSGIAFPPNTNSSEYFSALDYNAYYHKTTQNLYSWGATDAIKTLAALRTVSGQQWDVNTIQVTDSLKVPDPFIDRAGQDFRLKSDSLAATQKGKALPADVAAAIGLPSGTVPVRGVIYPATTLPTSPPPTTTVSPTPTVNNQPPVGPASLSAIAKSTSQINLSWPAATDDSAGLSYVVTRNGAKIYSGTNLSYSDTGLTASTTYNYQVTAVDVGFLTSGGAIASARTQDNPLPPADATPPTAPANVKASLSFNATRFAYDNNLSWTASTDTGGSGLRDYLVRRNGVDLGSTTTAKFRDSSIAANTVYSYEVFARDTAGNVSAPGTARLVARCFFIWCWAE